MPNGAEKDVENLQELLSTVVHDLSAPLRTMRGFSTLLQESYPQNLTDKQLHLLARIHHAAAIMQDKLSTLTDFQEVTRKPLVLAPHWAQDLFEQAVKIQSGTLQPAVIELKDDCPNLFVDRSTFTVALGELLKNALAAVSLNDQEPAAAGAVSVSRYRCETGEPDGLGLVVTDLGPGVSSQNQEQLFSLFRCGTPATGQLGVGLTLARWIARRHGGDCWIRPGSPCSVVLLAALTDR